MSASSILPTSRLSGITYITIGLILLTFSFYSPFLAFISIFPFAFGIYVIIHPSKEESGAMQLKEGEVIVKTGRAMYKGGSDRWSTYAGYGTLYLTNQRLVFEFTKSIAGMFLRRPKDAIEVPLATVRNVQPAGKEIPLSSLIIRVDYSGEGESKFLLLTPIGEHTQRYGSLELVAEWLAPIRRMANLPAKSFIEYSPAQINKRKLQALLLIIILLLVIIVLGSILLPMIFGTR